MLLITAIIWGFAFVAQSVGGSSVGAFTFNGARYLLGSLVLIPLILVFKKTGKIRKVFSHANITGGIACGLCLFLASSFQQFGVLMSTVSKASFITALYVVLVPVLRMFGGKKTGIRLWIAVVISVAGLYLLCFSNGIEAVGTGDLVLLAGAALFSGHILTIDHFSPVTDGIVVSSIQFFVAGVFSCICMLVVEEPRAEALLNAWVPIVYAGAMSCGVAYTLQVVFQKDVDPTAASLIMSLESVFGAVGGWLILGERLAPRELAGCALMMAAILMSQF